MTVASTLAVVAGALASAPAQAATAPFPQCPSVGIAPTCNVLVTIKGDGSTVIDVDGSLPPYDGAKHEARVARNVFSGLCIQSENHRSRIGMLDSFQWKSVDCEKL